MKKIKKILANQFSAFYYFYGFLRYRIFIALILTLIVGVLDAFGLTMFLPLLQMAGDSESVNAEDMGKLRFLVDGIQSLGFELNLSVVLLSMFFFFFLKGAFAFLTSSYNVFLNQHFIKQLRLKILKSLNTIQFKDFMISDAGRIQNTMSGEIEKIAVGYNFYMNSINHAIMVMVYMGFAFFVNFQFALLVTVGGTLTNILYSALYKKTKVESRELTKFSNIYQGQIIQHVANFRYLRSTGLVGKFASKIHKTINDIEVSRRKIGILNAILGAAREPLLISVIIVVILIQSYLLGGDLGGIIISLIFFYRALTSVTALQTAWNKYLGQTGSFENLKSLQKVFDNSQIKVGKEKVSKHSLKLNLQNVDFYYGDNKILDNISLDIIPRHTIAFVGESGSGKTTLVNILSGLMPVDNGVFKIGGKSAKYLDLSSFQKHIGYISQDPVIFNDSIYNNITFWDEPTGRNIKKFWEAVELASILDFVKNLDNKENTYLGNNGINISGGQKQRIAIARELYKDIEILIMDEATSALDSETEKIIQNSIDELKGKYTILLVAHRLSTVKNADKIVFMKKGKICSIGTFQELCNEREDFKRMVELQML